MLKYSFITQLEVVNKNETFIEPPNVVSVDKITERQYFEDKYKDYVIVNFAKQDLYILLIDPLRQIETKSLLYSSIRIHLGVTEMEIKSKKRTDNIAFARQIFHYVSYKKKFGSFPEIAAETNNKHPLALYSFRKISEVEKFGTKNEKDILSKIKKDLDL